MKCICTVITKRFLPGFRALTNSILRHTKFDEEFLCLDIDLTESDRKECLKIYPKCKFIQIDKSNYRKLPQHAPALTNAFFKLEVFKLARSYDRLLFIDSDIVFVDSIQKLLDLDPPKEAALVYHTSHHEYNSGLILLGRLDPLVHDKVMDLLKGMKRAHLADQTVIMEAIRRKLFSVDQLSSKWNTTKRQAKQGAKYIGLHFVGKKPWLGGEEGYKDFEALWHKYGGGK